jgi:hypothetical protein
MVGYHLLHHFSAQGGYHNARSDLSAKGVGSDDGVDSRSAGMVADSKDDRSG